MPLRLIELVGGRTALDDTVEIAIIEYYDPAADPATARRFWHIYSSAPTADQPLGNTAEMTFVEASVPWVVRQLYAALIWHGARTRYDAERNTYKMYGPHLCRLLNEPVGGDGHAHDDYPTQFTLDEHDAGLFLAAFEPMPRPTPLAVVAAVWHRFQWIFDILTHPGYRAVKRAYRVARRWRQIAAAAPKKRALARTTALYDELIAAAWHPMRFRDWCLDGDEQRDIADMFGVSGSGADDAA